MRKIYLFLIATIVTISASAQSSANYVLSTFADGNLTLDANNNPIDMSTGTTQLIGPSHDDAPISALTDIGFEFYFMGTRNTNFSVTANGIVELGGNSVSGSLYALSSNTTLRLLGGYVRDLETGTDGKIHYKVSGTAPNRVLVIEFTNMMIVFGTNAPGGATWQVRLYETTGVFEYVYGPMATNAGTQGNGNVGFTVNTAANKFMSVNSTHTPNTTTFEVVTPASNSTITHLHSPAEGNRRFYRFTPPSPAPNPPTNLTFTAVTLTSMTVNWTDGSTNEVGFDVYRSNDGINYTLAGTVASTTSAATGGNYNFPATGLSGSSTFYWRVIAKSEGSGSTPLDGSQALSCTVAGGTKTICPSGCDFVTIAAAVTNLQANGITGPITLALQPTYTTETTPIVLGAIPCASSINTITIITAGSARTITSASTTATFDINAGDYWIIDGRLDGTGAPNSINIVNTSTSGVAVRFINDATNNKVRYANIRGVTSSSSSGVIFFTTSTGLTLGNSNNTIEYNDITNGATFIFNGIYSSGTSTAPNINNTISNNNIFNFGNIASTTAASGVRVNLNGTGWTINNNNFYQTLPRTYTSNGGYNVIWIDDALSNNVTITKNFIGGSGPGATGTWTQNGVSNFFTGLRLTVGTAIASNIQENTIRNVSLNTASTSTTANTGIAAVTGSMNIGTTTPNLINNINIVGVTSTSPVFAGIMAGTGTAGNINISNNQITNITTSATTGGFFTRGINIQSGATSYIVSGNTISNITNNGNQTTQGIHSSSSSASILISDNTISNLTSAGLVTYTGNAVTGISVTSGTNTIAGNTITDISSTTSNALHGITVAATAQVLKNKIYDVSGATASSTVNGILVSSGTVTITNNRIGELSTPAANPAVPTNSLNGINITGGTRVSVDFNTVLLNSTSSGADFGSSALAVSATVPFTLRSNILINKSTPNGTGISAVYRRTGSVNLANHNSASNNNLYYGGTPGPNTVIFNDGVESDEDLLAYKTRMSLVNAEASSVTEDVVFVSTTGANADFLKIDPTTPTLIESGAVQVPGVTDDFEGTIRQGNVGYTGTSNFNPDIGADEGEFTRAPDPISPAIIYTPLGALCWNSTNNDRVITAVISDASGTPTTGPNIPRIYFRKTGGAYVSASGVFASGNNNNSTWTFTISEAAIGGLAPGDEVFYFIAAQDLAIPPNVGSSPGGAVGTDVNTLTTTPPNPASYPLGMEGGTFNVGVGGHFETLTAAIRSYNTGCMTGPITLVLTDGTYPDEVYPIVVNNVPAASVINTLTIMPASGVSPVFTGNATVLIDLNGAQYVSIDGSNSGSNTKDLTFSNTNTAGAVVRFVNEASNNTVKNSLLRGVSTSTSNGVVFISTTTGTNGNDNNSILNNEISGGATTTAYGIFNLGTTTSSAHKNSGIQITGNKIYNFSATGLRDNGGSAGTLYSNNEIYSGVAQTSTTLIGFRPGSTTIEGFIFDRNNIHDLITTAATATVHGIELFDIQGAPHVGQVSNNFINLSASNATLMRGIYDNTATTESFNIWYNSIRIGGTANSGTSEAYFRNIASITSLKNNILTNFRTGGAGKHMAIRTTTTLTGLTSDNNDIYNSGGTGNIFGSTSTTAGTAEVANLPAWRTATSRDANSISDDPGFVSPNDLHIFPGWSIVEGKASTSTTVTDDIDTDPRDPVKPDIGADEYVALVGSDVGVVSLINPPNLACYSSVETVTVVIRNYGSTDIDMSISNIIVFVTASPYGYNSNIVFNSGIFPAGATMTVDMPFKIDMTIPGTYVFNASTSVVGGDINPFNDNLNPPVTRISAQLNGVYNIGPGLDFNDLTTAITTFNSGCIGGPVTFQLANGYSSAGETFPLSIEVNVSQGTYPLTIKPAAGVAAVISGSAPATALIRVRNKYVTIDGLKTGGASLTLENTGTTAGSTVLWNSSTAAGQGASNNTYKNLTIRGGVDQNTSTIATFGIVNAGVTLGTSPTAHAAGNDNDNNTIHGNTFTRLRFAIVSRGGSTANPNLGTVISNNIIGPTAFGPDEIGAGGILAREEDGITITQNEIRFVGGDFANTTGGGDKVGISLASDFSWGTTITSAYVKNATITRNSIHDIVEERTFSAVGIVLSGADATNVTNNIVANNMIYGMLSNGTGGDQAVGIGIGAGNGDKVVYNSIHLTGDTDPDPASSASAPTMANFGVSVLSTTPTNLTLKNNIIFNDLSSSNFPTLRNADINTPAGYAWGTGGSDYNDLYIASTNPQSNVGNTGGGSTGVSYNTLPQWQTASGQDINSISVMPNFISATNLHLNQNTNCKIDAHGIPIAGINTDFDNQTRHFGKPDIGADEIAAPFAFLAGNIANAKECSQQTIQAGGTFFYNSNCELIAKVAAAGGSPVTSTVNTCVTVDGTVMYWNAQPYVQRHYDIEPTFNSANATAFVTLYFTQQDFDNYNASNTGFPDLPTGPGDVGGIARLNVIQYHGIGTGPTPGDYPGTSTAIDPVDSDIVWNASFGRWEVSFNVNGFSGFFVRTGALFPVPIAMEYFKGKKVSTNSNLLTWKGNCSSSSINFELQRSADGARFTSLTNFNASQARCASPFDYTDVAPLAGKNYYRLKMTEPDGRVSYSIIVLLLNNKEGFEIVGLLPTLVDKGTAVLNVSTTQRTKLDIIVTDIQGRIVQKQTANVEEGSSTINMNFTNLAGGSYQLTGITPQGMVKTIRFVKQ